MNAGSSCLVRTASRVCVLLLCTSPAFALNESSAPSHEPRTTVGVLVLAHGGTERWNGIVRKAVKQVDLGYPAEIALGMGMHPHEVRTMQQAADRLERKGISRLLVIPLLVSSHSDVYRQYEYLLGLRDEAPWPEAGAPLQLEVPVVMGQALDDAPAVAEVLLERAQALSRDPEEETVVLVGHGPNADVDNLRWLASMAEFARVIKQDGAFRDVMIVTIRDDALQPIQEEAKRQFREIVRAAGQSGRVLIVPLLLAQGGIEHKIPKLLTGLPYRYTGQTLLPHPAIQRWLAAQAEQLASGSGMADGSEAIRIVLE